MTHVRVVMTGHGRGQVFVDGHEVPNVRAIQFDADAGSRANELVLSITPETVEIEGPADVVTQDARLERLLREIADDPNTRLSPDLAFSLIQFRTPTPDDRSKLAPQKTWVCGCAYVRPLWSDGPCPGCGQRP